MLNLFYQENEVRTIVEEGEIWFVAKDVLDILEYTNHLAALTSLDEDERGNRIIHTPGGNQIANVINESGLYHLVLKSRKEEAKNFRRWLTKEVIPSIRTKGYYAAPGTKLPQSTQSENAQKQLEMAPQAKDMEVKHWQAIFLHQFNSPLEKQTDLHENGIDFYEMEKDERIVRIDALWLKLAYEDLYKTPVRLPDIERAFRSLLKIENEEDQMFSVHRKGIAIKCLELKIQMGAEEVRTNLFVTTESFLKKKLHLNVPFFATK